MISLKAIRTVLIDRAKDSLGRQIWLFPMFNRNTMDGDCHVARGTYTIVRSAALSKLMNKDDDGWLMQPGVRVNLHQWRDAK